MRLGVQENPRRYDNLDYDNDNDNDNGAKSVLKWTCLTYR